MLKSLQPSSPSASQAFSKSAQLAGMNVSLSACALAGLASKEDVTSVKLTSVSDVGSTNWPKVLLLRIKGMLFVHTHTCVRVTCLHGKRNTDRNEFSEFGLVCNCGNFDKLRT